MKKQITQVLVYERLGFLEVQYDDDTDEKFKILTSKSIIVNFYKPVPGFKE